MGGENVGLAEIEGLVSTHPAVHLVQAVGVPDERLEEVPAVFVQLKPGAAASEEELIAWCSGRTASFKVLRHVRFVRRSSPISATKISALPAAPSSSSRSWGSSVRAVGPHDHHAS